MLTRGLIAVAPLGAATTIFACGSSEPSSSSAPDHPTSCRIAAKFTLGDSGLGYLTTLPNHGFTAMIDPRGKSVEAR